MSLVEDGSKRFHNPLIKSEKEAEVVKQHDALEIIKNAEVLQERMVSKVIQSVGFLTLGAREFNFVRGEFGSGFLGSDGSSFVYDPVALINSLKPEYSDYADLCYSCFVYLHSLWHCLLGHVEINDKAYSKYVSQGFYEIMKEKGLVTNQSKRGSITYKDLDNRGKRLVFSVWGLACDICVSAVLIDHVVRADDLANGQGRYSANKGLLVPRSTNINGVTVDDARKSIENYKKYVDHMVKLRDDLKAIVSEIQNSRGGSGKALNVFEPIRIFVFLNEKIEHNGLECLREYEEFDSDSHELWSVVKEFADYDNEESSQGSQNGKNGKGSQSSQNGKNGKGSQSSQNGKNGKGQGTEETSEFGEDEDSKGAKQQTDGGGSNSESSENWGNSKGSSYQTGYQSKSEIQKQTSRILSTKKVDWKTSLKLIKSQMENSYRDFWQNSKNTRDTLNYLYKERYDFSTWLRRFCHNVNLAREDEESIEYGIYDYGCRTFGDKLLIEYPESKTEQLIEDFVVILDTSGSCSGELVKKFINKVYSMLMESTRFSKNLHVHIIQCDTEVQEYVVLKSLREVESYLRTMTVLGLGGTDFRPAFDFVENRIKSGEIKKLDGILYFTDGWGTMPTHSLGVKTAFVYLYSDRDHPETPQWIDDYVLEEKDLDIESM